MVIATCLSKVKLGDKIVSYRIQDANKKIIDLSGDLLKHDIETGRIQITNLKLTSNKRLIEPKDSGIELNIALTRQMVLLCNRLNSLRIKTCDTKSYLVKAPLVGIRIKDLADKVYLAIDKLNNGVIISNNKLVIIDETAAYENGRSLFSDIHINKLDLTNIDTSRVTYMKSLFRGSTIEILNLSGFNTSKVKDMSQMFCRSTIRELNISSFDTSNVEDMSQMFDNCYGLDSLDLSNFNTSKVKNMSQMFQSSNIKHINLSGLNTSNVEDMSQMFYGCDLNNLDLSSFNTSKVKYMIGMFTGTNADKLEISNFNTDNVIDFVGMFERAEIKYLKLSNMHMDGSTRRDMFGVVQISSSTLSSMFEGCAISKLDISGLKIGFRTGVSLHGMFSYSKIDELILPDKMGNIIDMSDMFYYCKVPSVKFPECNTSNLDNVKEIFAYSEVAFIDFSAIDFTNPNISGYKAFSNCKYADLKTNERNKSLVTKWMNNL